MPSLAALVKREIAFPVRLFKQLCFHKFRTAAEKVWSHKLIEDRKLRKHLRFDDSHAIDTTTGCGGGKKNHQIWWQIKYFRVLMDQL